MGWLGDLLKKVAGADSKDMIFVSTLPPPGGSDTVPLVADECYVTLYVESLRLERARKFTQRFQGVVYTFVSLARRGDQKAELAAVSKPEKLADLDSASLGKVITVSKQMMGTVPWRGGDFGIEIGLFSVKSGDLLTPVLNFVTKVSDTAGISFVGAIKPFVPLITDGMALLTGQQADTMLEVGADTSLTLTGAVTCAIIAAEKGSIDPAKLSIDPADRKLLLDGRPLEKGFCVFSIRTTDRKPDFGEIPELKEKFAGFRDAVDKGVEKDARDALAAFRRAAILSPDLITADARKLIATSEEMMKDAFAGGGIAENARAAGGPKTLAEVRLYDR